MRSARPLSPLLGASILALLLVASSPARAEDPIVKLVSKLSGKCLQPSGPAQGAAVIQSVCNGTNTQQWTVHSVNSTRVHLINRSTGLCLDARGGATNGTPIQQWTCNSISNENWGFGITNDLLSSAVSNTWSHCIFTPGTQAGLAVELRACTQTPAQLWTRPPG